MAIFWTRRVLPDLGCGAWDVVPAKISPFATSRLPADPTVTAPDCSEVRVLAGLAGGGMAHFQLAPGRCSAAIRHQTVEELWCEVAGEAQPGTAGDREDPRALGVAGQQGA